MEVYYSSTRNKNIKYTASQAILQGLCEDGGLFVPDHIPELPIPLSDFSGLTYQETAYQIMRMFLTDFSEEELKHCISAAYDSKFDTPLIAPLAKVGDAYYLELYHGATVAFKDMALSILPHLMTVSARKNYIEDDIVILTATSGDTGKAALAGFADVPGTKIIVFYPRGGVSRIQELMMVTQKGSNTSVVSIEGNFDDAQNGVKAAFADQVLKDEMKQNGCCFSSANSINVGRLIPQVVYYFYAYAQLMSSGEISPGSEINITVPTGNFGNILAAYYARKMGLPVHKLICASNENKVLFDFFQTGTYDRNRDFVLTSSPSMDILISSNLERLIYDIAGEDDGKVRSFMKSLKNNGSYEISDDMRFRLSGFSSGYADENETRQMIHDTFRTYQYIMDTHTAVAGSVYRRYRKETNDTMPTVIVSTASPYKFAHSVMTAIDDSYEGYDEFALIDELHRVSGMNIPAAVRDIRGASVIHTRNCTESEMKNTIRQILVQMGR